MKKFLYVSIVTALLILIADYFTKAWVIAQLESPSTSLYITPFFNLVLNYNYGVSFGFFNNEFMSRYLFIFISILILCILYLWLYKSSFMIDMVAYGLILGGAIGNIIDRLQYGAVVDFIELHLDAWRYPSFNIADSAIVLGVSLLVIFSKQLR